jgi:hypothetical protein
MPMRGKGPLRVAFEDLIQTYFINSLLKPVKRNILLRLRSMINDLLTGTLETVGAKQTAQVFRNILDDFNEDDTLFALFFGLPTLVAGIFWALFGRLFEVPGLLISYAQNRIFETYRADIASYIQMAFRHPGNETRFKLDASDIGIPSDLYEFFKSIYRPLMPPTELILALNRKLIDENKFRDELSKQGWLPEHINHFVDFANVIPPISDLIRMAVREAFTPEVAERFNYKADFPTPVLEHTRKIGLSDEWVQRYWFAHWDLPSATQGYEMLHRLRPGKTDVPFSQKDLELLLKANDVPEFYRRRLIEISYNPLTRVDIRRMRQFGILDYTDVRDAYLDDGYNEENATRLADFVEKEFGEDRKELSRSLIERGYVLGVLSRDDALTQLTSSGYGQDEANYILTLIDLRENEDDIRDSINLYSERYLEGLDDLNTLRSNLSRVDISSNKVDSITLKLSRIKEARERFPTLADFKRMLNTGIISEMEMREELTRMNFSSKNIDRLMRLFTINEK